MESTQLLNGINNVVFLKTILCDQLNCRKEDLDFRAVESFSLEHKNLLKINCLWPLSNLTSLNLANNYIKKIENIESLVHLKELNLSFNRITKIENLHTLVKLNKLLLYSNQIRVLENLDNLKNLKILNVGANLIKEKLFPFYLSQFKMLRAIVISENPCYADSNDIDEYLIALMPQLSDLNYHKITDKERYLASTHYKMKISGLKKFRLTEIGQPLDRVKSNHKTFKKRDVDFVRMSGNEIFKQLFQNHEVLLQLSDEGENFRRLNDKFQQKFVQNYDVWERCRDQYRKSFENFKEIYEDMVKKSSDVKEGYIRDFKSQSTKSTQNDIFGLRMMLLAEECNTEHRLEKLLKDTESNIMAEVSKIFENIKIIHENIKKELSTYVKWMYKNIENCFYEKTRVPYEFQPSSRENVFFTNINLEEFFNVFKGDCVAFINDSEAAAMDQIRNWKRQCTKMLQKNVIRHRKAVAEIMKSMEELTIDEKKKVEI